MNTKDDTTWHVWWILPWTSPNNRKIIDKYPNRKLAYREHRAASKEGLRSYITQHDPTNDKD